jgi:ribosomal protein S27AE
MMRPYEPVEDLYFAYPDCTICLDSSAMNTDGDGWYCEKCGTTWTQNGQHGERQQPDANDPERQA